MIARRHGGRLLTAPSPRGARLALELPGAARAAAPPGAMSRRRRAALLLGLALVLGALAASDVARREAALRAELGPARARSSSPAATSRPGRRLAPGDLAVRGRPGALRAGRARDAPPELLAGRRLAVPVAAGDPVGPLLLEPPAPPAGRASAARQRAAEVVAAAAPGIVAARARASTSSSRASAAPARARPSSRCRTSRCSARARRPPTPRDARPAALVAATLRVTVRQAVYLAAAGAFAREIRLLARAPGDRGRVGAVSAVG